MSNRIRSGEIQIGNHFVLPIEQTNVTVSEAKVKKMIEESDAKAREILDGAENKSKIITETANTEAETIIQNARKRGEEEYDVVKQKGYDEGFEEGRKDGLLKFQEEAAEAIKSLETLASSSFDTKKNIIDSASLDIVELVAAIAQKVCHAKFDSKILYAITLDAIKALNDKENITIFVNPILVENITSLVPDLKEEFPKLQSIKILEDNSVSPDGVIVETLRTRLDSRVSTQIDEIAQKMLTGADDELE